MKRDADEKELLDSVKRGEWKPAKGGRRERRVAVRLGRPLPPAEDIRAAVVGRLTKALDEQRRRARHS